MSIINLKYSEIIKNQATINIGCIGHVSEGKSTVVRRLTGIATQKHKKEKERNITIKLGYANFKIWLCDLTKKIFYSSSECEEYINPENNNNCILVKHLSFVDCPGHDSFMSTMLSGTSVMDSAFLLIAANNKVIPQVQTYEHLVAITNTNVRNVLILQNKIDLLNSKKKALENLEKINDFIEGSFVENSKIIPLSAQLCINMDKVCQYALQDIKPISDKINDEVYLPIIRSFDTNKPKTKFNNLKGGVIGGSLISGVIKVGDYIEIRPGIITNENGKAICNPIITTVESIFSEKKSIDFAIPGGLIGIGTNIDPYFCGSNRLVGQVMGKVGKLPNIYSEINSKIKRIKRMDSEKTKFTKYEKVMICINGNSVFGKIRAKGKKAKILFDKPICCKINQTFSIMKFDRGTYKLHSSGTMLDGKIFENIKYNCEYKNFIDSNKNVYKIEYDINPSLFEKYDFDYESMLNNFKFTKKKKNNALEYFALDVSRKSKQVSINNMYSIIQSLHNISDSFDYLDNFSKFFSNEVSKQCRFNEEMHFILSGKFKIQQLQHLIDKYIKLYVLCPICNSNSTNLTKEKKIIKINCKDCTAINSIIN